MVACCTAGGRCSAVALGLVRSGDGERARRGREADAFGSAKLMLVERFTDRERCRSKGFVGLVCERGLYARERSRGAREAGASFEADFGEKNRKCERKECFFLPGFDDWFLSESRIIAFGGSGGPSPVGTLPESIEG